MTTYESGVNFGFQSYSGNCNSRHGHYSVARSEVQHLLFGRNSLCIVQYANEVICQLNLHANFHKIYFLKAYVIETLNKIYTDWKDISKWHLVDYYEQ